MKRLAAALLSIFVFAIMASQPVSAKPTEVAGNLVNPTSELVMGPWTAGTNTFVVKENQWDWTGDITGHSIATVNILIHGTGMIGIHEYGTIYDATWGDLTGNITIVTVGKGDGTDFWLHFSVESGTYDFEMLDGHGDIHLHYDAEGMPHVDYVAWLVMVGM